MKLKEHLFSFDNRGLITEHGIMADDWMLGKQNVIARYLWLHTPFILLRGWNRFLTLKQIIHAINNILNFFNLIMDEHDISAVDRKSIFTGCAWY